MLVEIGVEWGIVEELEMAYEAELANDAHSYQSTSYGNGCLLELPIWIDIDALEKGARPPSTRRPSKAMIVRRLKLNLYVRLQTKSKMQIIPGRCSRQCNLYLIKGATLEHQNSEHGAGLFLPVEGVLKA